MVYPDRRDECKPVVYVGEIDPDAKFPSNARPPRPRVTVLTTRIPWTLRRS